MTERGNEDMKKKKIIIISIFLSLIAITSFVFLKAAIDSYRYDMDPANGVDILEGFGAVFALMLGGFVVFYELDLFYAVYYFFFRPKSIAKSIIVILSNVALLLLFFFGEIIFLGLYFVLKMACLVVGCYIGED